MNVIVLQTADQQTQGVLPFQPVHPNTVFFFKNVLGSFVHGVGLLRDIKVYFLDADFNALPGFDPYLLRAGSMGPHLPPAARHLVETSNVCPDITDFSFLRRF